MEPFLHPAEDKLREADFFLFLMRRHFHDYEFKYFLSAFLSALSSCTEHNRLFSRDPRFKDWYQEVKKTVASSVLGRLDVLRNKEVHQTGTPASQRVGFSTGSDEPIETTHLEFTIDFREGAPKGTIKTAEMAEAVPINLTTDWVWDAEGSPNVMMLCEEGYKAVAAIIQNRAAMNFQD
jgi:hypothetical protein